jgi:class 3 adenylate cyclase
MAEARKTVTVVFADVSGSTALGERLDAEALRGVMERYFAEARTAFERHGGTVEKFIGDAVVAVFGIPAAHEDDALRAVRAAHDLRNGMTRLNADLKREAGITLGVRTGINTGEVVAGDSASGQFYATGDAVNVAARLEQTAAPGEIVLSETTYELVREFVEVDALEELTLRGKAEPVLAYRLLTTVERVLSLARRFDTPFVGRRSDLARLLECCERSVTERAPTLVTVLGPAGIGKTRLAGELVAETGEGATVLQGRCLSYGEGITFWPLQEILRSLTERPAGAPDPTEAKSTEEAFWAYRKLFESLAQQRPLLLLLEDIHWAEPMLLDLIEHVVEWTADAPIAVVCLARPELMDDRPGWPGERLELGPLPDQEAKQLVAALAADLDPSVRARAMEVSEGNPLFLEQLLALAAEDGQKLVVPHTIQALLGARLDRLDAEERALLERAAIVGKEFWRSALLALSPPATEVSSLLQRLMRKRLILPERSSFAGEDAFRFGHILIREAAYEAIPKAARADLHERYAAWLDMRPRDQDEFIGYHLEQAVRYRRELGPAGEGDLELAARAGKMLAAGGRRAAARGDYLAAANLLERAGVLLSSETPDAVELLIDLGAAFAFAGELARAEEALERATIGAARLADDCLIARATLQRSFLDRYLHPERGTDELFQAAEQAIKVLEGAGDDIGLARAWRLLAEVHWTRLQVKWMEDALRRARSYAERAGAEQEILLILDGLARSAVVGPLPVSEAVTRCREIVKRAAGHRMLVANVEAMRAYLEAMRGDFEMAHQLADESSNTLTELGAIVDLAALRAWTGEVEMLAGEPQRGEQMRRAAYTTLDQLGERAILSTIAAYLAESLYAQGRDDEALAFTAVSAEAAGEDDITSQILWRVTAAKVKARDRAVREAEALAHEAVTLAEGTDCLNLHGDALVALAEVFAAQGRQHEAAPLATHALRLYEAKGNLSSAGTLRRRLDAFGVRKNVASPSDRAS